MCSLLTNTLIVDLIYGTLKPQQHVDITEYNWIYWDGVGFGNQPWKESSHPGHILGKDCYTDPDTIAKYGLSTTVSTLVYCNQEKTRGLLALIRFMGHEAPRWQDSHGAYFYQSEISHFATPKPSWIDPTLWSPANKTGYMLYVNPQAGPSFISSVRNMIYVNDQGSHTGSS